MSRKKLQKGGDFVVKTQSIWMIVGAIVFGLFIGAGILWIVLSRRLYHNKDTTNTIITRVVEVPQHKNTSPSLELPVYPNRNPTYPIRSGAQSYQQIGTLTHTPEDAAADEPIVLPLFGKRMDTRPNRWEYYTATDKQHMLRVPIMYEGRDCQDEIGCDEIYKGDKVQVPVYGKIFEVNLYKFEPTI